MGDIYIEGITKIELSKINSNILDSHHDRELIITLNTDKELHVVLSSHDRDVLEIIDCETHPSMEDMVHG